MNAFARCCARVCLSGSVLCLFASGPTSAAEEEAIQVGDTVTIVAEKAELGLRDQAGAELAKGDKLHVTELRGEWVGGFAFVKGQRRTGWLNRSEVKLLNVAATNAPVIEVPDKADDAAAVTALKGVEVRVELNAKGNVQSLAAAESKLTDGEAAHLAGLHQLASVELSNRPVGDATLEKLAGCSTLQELYLDHTKVTDAGLKHLQKLKNLEVLALNDTSITSAGLSSLSGLSQLRVLNLSNCAVTDDGLKHLSKLANLDTLALPSTKVTSAGLVHLKPLARLRVLNLNQDQIDDAGLTHLMDHSELRMLYLKKTKVTSAGIQKLDDAVAGLAIYRN